MPVAQRRITDTSAARLAPPVAGQSLWWCPEQPGFGVRVTAGGARTWVAQLRQGGKSVRRKLGSVDGAGAISASAARKLARVVSGELALGHDRLTVERSRQREKKADALTFGQALLGYVNAKRRAKDGLPLKQRTKDDYMAMVAPAGVTKRGAPTLAGELHALAAKPLHKISADDIRKAHAGLASRGERRQTYAMQVLRAVLRFNGVQVEGNPLDPGTAGAQRVALAPSRGKPSPIPPERLGAWWRAACSQQSVSADQLRFMLLTGCRPGEAAGILAGDFDLKGERVTLRDTKNRRDHVLLLSQQAAAIVHWHADGKKAKAPLFGVADTGKTIATINAAAGTPGVSPHKLRHTFASVAQGLMPVYTYWRLMNRAAAGDVDAAHYVGMTDKQQRAAWQAVADHIEAA